jgi:hypothetical protein
LINDNAQGSPQSVSLSGTGLAAAVSFHPTGVSFAAQAVGSTGASKTITLTDSGSGALNVTNIQVTGDFAYSGSCSTVAASGGTCQIQVSFAPTVSGCAPAAPPSPIPRRIARKAYRSAAALEPPMAAFPSLR